MRIGKKEERSSEEEVVRRNTHDVRDEPGGAEGGQRIGLTMTVSRIHRIDSTR